jgi:hypothetical protein
MIEKSLQEPHTMLTVAYDIDGIIIMWFQHVILSVQSTENFWRTTCTWQCDSVA